MGRIKIPKERHNKPSKTYSKVSICYEKKNINRKDQKKVRKPLPKFEELFLEKDKTETSSQFSIFGIQDLPKTKFETQNLNSSEDSSKLLNDTFDAIAGLKIIGSKDLKKASAQSNLTHSPSSEDIEWDSFKSASSPDMFMVPPYDCIKQTKTPPSSPKGQNVASCDSIVELPKNTLNTMKPHLNSNSKGIEQIAANLPLLITSTPTAYGGVRKSKNLKFKKSAILESDLSPVIKETPQANEMSLINETNSNFLSCFIHSFGPNNHHTRMVEPDHDSCEENENVDPLLQNKIKECLIYLTRFNSHIDSLPSDSQLGAMHSFDISHKVNKPEFNLEASLGRSFHRVTRRRKICPSPFYPKNLSKDKLWPPQPCIKEAFIPLHRVSHYRKIKDKRATSQANKILNSPNLSIQLLSCSRVSSLMNFKSGKGWRRRAKNISLIKKLESSTESSLAEINSIECWNKSSILQMEPFKDSNEEDPRNLVLNLCCQEEELSLSFCLRGRNGTCKKIGEGLYGEVFIYYPDSSGATTVTGKHVLKIMPIEGDFDVNGEPQKTFREIAPEIVVSKALSELRDESADNSTSSFVKVERCWCVRGSYPERLLDLWDAFMEEKGSENVRPDIFPDYQLHIILEFEFAGQDLESYVFNNGLQAYSSFLQVAYALAVAEEEFQFEHRDLHWGNVLIRPTSESTILYTIRKKCVKLKTQGVRATVIDFTLSRLYVDGRSFFNDLAQDPSLFSGEGDYQFEIYRKMQRENGNNWKEFNPVTNIYWLHYLSLKLLNDCYYKNKTTQIHKEGMKKLKSASDSVLSYTSALNLMSDLHNPPLELT